MTTLKSKKKPELQAIAAELGIDTDGNKADLEMRISEHMSSHSELQHDPKFRKIYEQITGSSSAGPSSAGTLGSLKRRSIAAKKSTDLGQVVSKALTRYLFTFA
jgi:hypothetical protein